MIRWFYVFVFFAFLFACDTASNIKSPDKNYFLKYFGGNGSQTAVDLIVNNDGTFFILGNARASADSVQKIYLAKANAFGDLLWQKTYGTTVDMNARDFLLTADGSYLVVAANKNLPSGTDLVLNKYTTDGVKSDSILLSNAFGNSVTELSDGGFIVEGYQRQSNQLSELHFRVANPWGVYAGGPGGVWAPIFSSGASSYVGVSTIEFSPTDFYTFGYTNALYSGTTNNKFYAYDLGYNGTPTPGGVTNNGTFDKSRYPSDKTLTCAIRAGRGGYLLVGISSSPATDSLKVAITNTNGPANYFSFDSTGVDKDLVLQDLGKSQTLTQNYATAFSAPSYNFILTNTYKTASSASDILLLKLTNALSPAWDNPVQLGGDGDDTAAAVSELPDGHIMVLGTMQLGNPVAQFKIVLMKLNSDGKLAD